MWVGSVSLRQLPSQKRGKPVDEPLTSTVVLLLSFRNLQLLQEGRSWTSVGFVAPLRTPTPFFSTVNRFVPYHNCEMNVIDFLSLLYCLLPRLSAGKLALIASSATSGSARASSNIVANSGPTHRSSGRWGRSLCLSHARAGRPLVERPRGLREDRRLRSRETGYPAKRLPSITFDISHVCVQEEGQRACQDITDVPAGKGAAKQRTLEGSEAHLLA